MEEPQFLFDPVQEEREEILKEIHKTLKPKDKNAIHLRRFVKAMFKSSYSKKKHKRRIQRKLELKKHMVPKKNHIGISSPFYVTHGRSVFEKINNVITDKKVDSIYCDGPGKNVSVVANGKKIDSDIVFDNNSEIDLIIDMLANRIGKGVDKDNPILDGFLENGYRVQATLGSNLISSKFLIRK